MKVVLYILSYYVKMSMNTDAYQISLKGCGDVHKEFSVRDEAQ